MTGADVEHEQEAFTKSNIQAVMHKVNAYQLENLRPKPDREWIRPTYYTGVMAFYKATNDQSLRKQCLEYAKKHQWLQGQKSSGANSLTVSQVYLELYFEEKDQAMIQPTLDWVNSGNPKTPTGAKVWYLEGGRRYSDSLYVGPPALAMLGAVTGDKKYFDYMDAFYWDVHEEIFDKESKLFYRDKRFIAKEDMSQNVPYEAIPESQRKTFVYQLSKNKKKVFWSRGNGWVIAGLPRIMTYLPEGHPSYKKYEELFKTMAYSLKDRQGKDGYWRVNLDDADDFPMPESSGTGFIVYGLAWGINNGILPEKEFLPVVRKAWHALYYGVSDDGKVQWGQLVGGGPYMVKEEDTHEYVTGTFLLAGSEMLKLATSVAGANDMPQASIIPSDVEQPPEKNAVNFRL